MLMRPIPVILDLHVEDAAMLWLRRDIAVNAPHYDRIFLSRLDEQLEAHVDGLRVAGPAGWDHAKAGFDANPEPGEFFSLASLAIGSGDAERIETVIDALRDNPDELLKPFQSAVGWMPFAQAQADVEALLSSEDTTARMAGLAACSVHRHDPHDALETALDAEPVVRARANRLAAELGRADLLHRILAERTDDTEDSRFWTQWAITMLGDREVGPQFLLDAARKEGPNWELAFRTGLLALGADAGWQWLDTLDLEPHGLLLRVVGFGLLGDPGTLPWLISQMDSTDHGRQAGESFALITGVDLEYVDLDKDEPEGFEFGPNDDPDDPNVTLDPNEDVPWPDAYRVEKYLQEELSDLPKTPIFMGRERSNEVFEHTMLHGYQRQRRAAAFCLALRHPGAPLPNWKVPVRDLTLH